MNKKGTFCIYCYYYLWVMLWKYSKLLAVRLMDWIVDKHLRRWKQYWWPFWHLWWPNVLHVNSRSAYEQSIFCDVFHSKESGWRECTLCGKVRQRSRIQEPVFAFPAILSSIPCLYLTIFGILQRLHCGCVASSFVLELLDSGGVKCINCVKNSGLRPVRQSYMIYLWFIIQCHLVEIKTYVPLMIFGCLVYQLII